VTVASLGPRTALAPPVVRRVVAAVLDGEGAGPATINVTFLATPSMRVLNRRTFGRNRATDVIAFRLPHDGVLAGDVYVCPSVARSSARLLKLSAREELIRLVVHGTLHVLGHDHPEGPGRTTSPMWRRQERYVRRLTRGACE
jgi:probable rRNA maturation factor